MEDIFQSDTFIDPPSLAVQCSCYVGHGYNQIIIVSGVGRLLAADRIEYRSVGQAIEGSVGHQDHQIIFWSWEIHHWQRCHYS